MFGKRWWVIATGLFAVLAGLGIWRYTGVHEVAVRTEIALAQLALSAADADDHPCWRGASHDGIAPPGQYPVRWSTTENVRWKASVPGLGHATPCVWDQQVFIFTAVEEDHTHWLLSYDRGTGQEQWRGEVHRGDGGPKHVKNSHASATPACDGRHVYINFVADGKLWVAAVERSGGLRWKTEAGPYRATHGYGSSPALFGGLVIVAADNRGARLDRLVGSSFLAALHNETGEIAWRIKRPAADSYGTPIVAQVAGRPQLLLAGHEMVAAYDPATGQERWRCRWKAANVACTMAFDDQHVYVGTTEGDSLTLCIRADGQGDVTDTHIVWQQRSGASYVPSPLLYERRLYVVSDKGVLSCLDTSSGKQLYKQRLGGDFSASPVAAGGLIYATSEAGKTHVIRPGEKYELLATNDCGEETLATPAFCGEEVFLRTRQSLWCVSTTPNGTHVAAKTK